LDILKDHFIIFVVETFAKISVIEDFMDITWSEERIFPVF
jgi:hypothetical protein